MEHLVCRDCAHHEDHLRLDYVMDVNCYHGLLSQPEYPTEDFWYLSLLPY